MASFLDLFSVVDSDGAAVARYRLNYMGSALLRQDSWIFGMVTEFVYLVFQLMVVPANALLGAVLNSGQWMEPLSYVYQRVTGPLFTMFPPWALACLGLAVVAISAFKDQVASTSGKLFDEPIRDRVGAVFGLVILVLVLTNNPFALLQRLLELANGFSVGLASAISGGDGATLASTGQALVDATIRIPTLVLNYGQELTPACQTQWSEAMAAGQALPETSGCFTPGSNEAGIGSLATAVLMLLLPALPMLVFCVVAAWKYLLHLTLAAGYLISTSWIAAIAVFKRRGFDTLSRHVAKTGAHLAMAVITSMMAAALPALFAGLATELLKAITNPTASAFALMTALGIGFAASAFAIIKVTSNHGALVRMLHADTNHHLTKVLGIDPKSKAGVAAERRAKARAAGGSNSPAGATARTARVKGTSLAADPIAATTPVDVPTADPRGAAMGTPSSADENAVSALSAAARSVADASTVSGTAETSTIVVTPTDEGAGSTGFFSRDSERPVAYATASEDAAETAPTPTSNDGPETVDTRTVTADRSSDFDPVQPAETVAATAAPAPAPSAAGGVLADPVRMTPGTGPEVDGTTTPSTRGVRGVFTAAADTARAVRERVSALPFSPGLFLRHQPPETPEPGAVPQPLYAMPIILAGSPDVAPEGDLHPTGEPEHDEPVNDQQRFNRMRRAGRAVVRKGRDTLSRVRRAEPVPSPSGAMPAPDSFIAPKADFLAGDAMAAGIEEATVTLAAAGKQIRIEIDPDSPIGGIQMTSDPDERLRPSDTQGFGDPY